MKYNPHKVKKKNVYSKTNKQQVTTTRSYAAGRTMQPTNVELILPKSNPQSNRNVRHDLAFDFSSFRLSIFLRFFFVFFLHLIFLNWNKIVCHMHFDIALQLYLVKKPANSFRDFN